ncbi:MAG TPA: Imm27 family immunity protein [Methylomirabilota bacterium]|nr:Imm27 family immunity protein [Methylomirabilota bacterium]
MKIDPSETLLTGNWLFDAGQIKGDMPCERIHALIMSHLILLARDSSGWDSLYVDPADKRLWELTYPQSELHGSGPPQLRALTTTEARKKYDVDTSQL